MTMKLGVILADVSCGSVVACATFDVFEIEPLAADSPMWASENTLMPPHCSSAFVEWAGASFDLFQTNLARWIKGKDLLNDR